MPIDVNSLNFPFIANSSNARSLELLSRARTALDDSGDLLSESRGAGAQAAVAELASDAGRDRRERGFLRPREEGAQRRLAQLLPVRARLEPSDEVTLFAQNNRSQTPVSRARAISAEDTEIAVEILTAQQNANASKPIVLRQNLAARYQVEVASRYARNNDVTFATTPVALFAA